MAQYRLFTGQQFRAGPRRVGDGELVRGADKTSPGTAVASSLWRTTAAAKHVVEHVEEQWIFEQVAPAAVDLYLDVTVVRLDGASAAGFRTVTFHRELVTLDSQVVQSGVLRAVVHGESVEQTGNRDVGTLAWGRLLGDALAGSSAFSAAVASWDGAIGLRAGHREVHLRIYRGRIIEVSERSPRGATFTLSASDLVWARFLTAPSMRFSSRLLGGDFASSGDPYEYLRLSKAVEIIAEAARVLAAPDAVQGRPA